MFRIIKRTNIDFIGHRKKAYGVSGVLLLLGIICFAMILFGKANLGIDFAGGTMVQGWFQDAADISDLRTTLSGAGFEGAYITHLEGREHGNTFLIRVKVGSEGGETVTERIMEAVATGFPGNTFTLDSVHEVGASIGRELKEKAIWMVALAVCGILLYIWIRFDFRFGVAATVATFHDVLAVLGIFFILNKEITLLVIVALLTLAGYSLTDSVVVFDRIRENLKTFRRKGDFVATINGSINEVLSRTLMTSFTTLTVVFVLFIAGGTILRDFAFALIIGVLVGTYSSVFVASPIVVEWEHRSPKRFK
jgi:preprotein translocase subunit SecF